MSVNVAFTSNCRINACWWCEAAVPDSPESLQKNTHLTFMHYSLCPSILLLYSIHPFMPLLATSSGQRQFPWPGDSEGDSASDSEGAEAVMPPQETRQDNTLNLWWAGPLGPAVEGNPEQSTAAVEAWSAVSSASWHKLSYTCHVILIFGMFCVDRADHGSVRLSLPSATWSPEVEKHILNIRLPYTFTVQIDFLTYHMQVYIIYRPQCSEKIAHQVSTNRFSVFEDFIVMMPIWS